MALWIEAEEASAMQFTVVVSTTPGAVHLGQDRGSHSLATLPNAFRHPTLGYVAA